MLIYSSKLHSTMETNDRNEKVCKIKLSVHNPSALLCIYILSKCQLLKQANCVKTMGGKLKKMDIQ